MKTLIKAIFVLLLILSYGRSMGQKTTDKVPIITISSTILYYTLADYIAVSKAPVVAIFMERSNNEYTYFLYNPTSYEFIEDNPPTYWGRWQGKMLLFYTGLETIIQPADSTTYKQLLIVLQPVLKRQYTTLPDSLEPSITATVNGRRVELIKANIPATDGDVTWCLKTKAGKEISLEKDFDSVTRESRTISIPYSSIPYSKFKTGKRTLQPR